VNSKRLLDVVIATFALGLSAPLLAVLAITIKLDSSGPVIYRARRVGLDGRDFRLLKLRTMAVGADQAGPAITADSDTRVTRAGRWLRRLKLDELPQFLNVLRGEMSVVGPRPEHPDFVERYSAAERAVLAVRPGITSLASLEYSDESSLLVGDVQGVYVDQIMPAKLALDLEYVRHQSLWLDLAIIGRTAALVFARALGGGRTRATSGR
jgi:lipopolysaccharide/colanic/teichoic acid biosynthesis glycosyltransferase